MPDHIGQVCFMMSKRKIVTQWLKIVCGLIVFAFGVHLTIYANIGLAPWDCLGVGVANHTPFNYGISMTIISLVVLGIDVLLKEKIGYGTIIDAILTGNFIQIFNDLNPFPTNEKLWLGVVCMLTGFVFMAIGMWIYMKEEQCCGPKDAFLVGVGKRFPKVPIGIVEVVLWAIILLLGWLLGGPVGVGTLLSTFFAGLVMQLVYAVIRFEPRNLQHKDVVEVTKMMFEQ